MTKEEELKQNQDNNIHIFYSCNDTFIRHLCTSIASILHNADKKDLLSFHILNNDISQENRNKILNLRKIKKCNIEFIDIDNELFKNCPLKKGFPYLTIQSYYRFIIADIKHSLDKAIYLDCDTVVTSSLSDLWNIDLGDNYCGVVQDMNAVASHEDEERLNIDAEFNAGVLLINVKKWKDENISQKLFESVKKLSDENILLWMDQDGLNYTFDRQVVWINPKYNYQKCAVDNLYYTKYTDEEVKHAQDNVVIIHYNGGEKPWEKRCDFYDIEYYKSLYYAGWRLEALRLFYNHYIKQYLIYSYEEDRHRVLSIFGIKIKFRKKH